jgi:hypothetical protein
MIMCPDLPRFSHETSRLLGLQASQVLRLVSLIRPTKPTARRRAVVVLARPPTRRRASQLQIQLARHQP